MKWGENKFVSLENLADNRASEHLRGNEFSINLNEKRERVFFDRAVNRFSDYGYTYPVCG